MSKNKGTKIFRLRPNDAVTLSYSAGACGYHSSEVHVTDITVLNDETGCSTGSCGHGGGGGGDGDFGSGSVGTGSIEASLALGRAMFGDSAGSIWMSEASPSLALASPRVLNWNDGPADVVVLTNTVDGVACLRQILAPQGLADVVTNGAFGFDVRFYHAAQVGGVDGFGFYTATNPPFRVWRFENPDASTNTYSRYLVSRITEGVTNRTYLFTWYGTSNTWFMTESGAWGTARSDSVKDEVVIDGSVTNTVYTYSVYEGSTLLSRRQEFVTPFPWGNAVTKTVNDPDGAALTSEWRYYTESDVSTNDPNYGQLKAIITETGYWETYVYTNDGFVMRQKSQYLDAPFDAADNQCRLTLRHYDFIPGNEAFFSTTEHLLGKWVASRVEETDPGAPGKTWADGSVTVVNGDGDPLSVRHPDGTVSLYVYSEDGTTRTTVVDVGAPNNPTFYTAITNGVRTVTVVDRSGNLISEHRYDIPQTDVLLSAREVTSVDEFGRPLVTRYNDGTTESVTYSPCCGLEASTGRDGVTTYYEYDQFGRMTNEIRAGLSTYHTYDAANRLVKTARQAAGFGPVTMRLAQYDVAGRLTNVVDAAGNATASRSYTNDAGHSVSMETYPDGSYRMESRYPDGHTLSITGTAVHAVQYAYGVGDNPNQLTPRVQAVTEILLGDGAATNAWTRRWTDYLGRPSVVEYADGSSETNAYNFKRQLERRTDRDGMTTLFLYDDEGGLRDTVVDMNGNNAADFAGLDRITRTASALAVTNQQTVLVTRTWVWPSNSVNAAALVSEAYALTNAQHQWSVTYGLAHEQRTVPDGAGGSTNTVIEPDGSFAVSIYSAGRIVSATQYSSASQQVGRVDYVYDTLGRQIAMIDARNGMTSNAFDNADRVIATTRPAPAVGLTAPTVTNAYDSMGRLASIALPDGGIVSNLYHATGELRKTFGSRTYPVEYGYDAQGRMTNMVTWHSHAGNQGQAGTTWRYAPETGYMTNKVFADGSTNAYSYTAGGKLKTRRWARGITTTYGYGAAGDLLTVGYSDSTPGVTNTVDRLGRVTAVLDGAGGRNLTYHTAGALAAESHTSGLRSGWGVSHTLDALNRMAGATFQATVTSAVSYAYDAASRLATMQADASTFSYGYHTNSSLIASMGTAWGTNTALVTTRAYDKLHRLTSIQHSPSATANVSFAYSYNLADQRTRVELADGSYWVYAYDGLGQLVSGGKFWSNGVAVAGQEFQYHFDDIGNRTAVTNNGRASAWTANSLNQYTQRTLPGAVDILGTAATGATVTVNNQATTRQGGYFHRALAVSNAAGAAYTNVWVVGVTPGATNDIVSTETGMVFLAQTPETFMYDLDGNLLTDGRWTNRWDGANQLVGMETLPALTNQGLPRVKLEFAYDSQGRRVRKTLASWTGGTWSTNRSTLFLYDGWNLVATEERQAATTNWEAFVWGLDLSGSLQGAGGIGGLLARVSRNNSSTQTLFYAHDGNGNVTDLIATNGTSAGHYEYGPFGEPLGQTGPMAAANPFRWSTKYADQETGLVMYPARPYSPSLGRFISRDPIGERGGLNLYGFVGNDPVDWVDAFGLSGNDPPSKVAMCYCCCANSIGIASISRVDTPTRMGHSFNVNIGLSYPLNASATGDCTLQWKEKTNIPAVPGHPPNQWTDMYALVPTSSTFAPWNARTRPPGGTENVTITDIPSLARRPNRTDTRTLEFDIVVNSGANCPCPQQSVNVTAKQVLKMVNGAPQWNASSFTTP